MRAAAPVSWILACCTLLGGCPESEILLAGDDGAVAVVDAGADGASLPVDAAATDRTEDDGARPDASVVADAVPSDAVRDAAAPDHVVTDASAPDQAPPVDAAVAADATAPGPGGCIRGSFSPYHGNMHAHTSASDGEGTFAEAFAYARDQGALDFFIVTDHLEQLYGLDGEPTDEWDTCWDEADLVNVDGSYVALCGFEHGSAMSLSPLGPAGHVNVFFSDRLFPAIQLRLSELYASIAACTTCVTQFNHPLDEASMCYDDFAYDAAVDERMNLLEFNTSADAWAVLHQALDQGWHVSPTWNQDNHSANWGTANSHRSGLFLSALTRAAVASALRERRSFATSDANAAIRLLAGECWMGSIVDGVAQTVLRVEADDADDGYDRIELSGPGAAVLATIPCGGRPSCGGEHALVVTQPTYVIARGLQADGDVVTSAPIWLAP